MSRESRYKGTGFVASSAFGEEAKGGTIVPKREIEVVEKGAAMRNTCAVV